MATLDVAPAHPGENRITVTLTNADGAAMTPQEVSVWVSSPALGVEAEKYRAVRVLPGRYFITAPLPIAGTWKVEIDALVTDFNEVVFTTEVPVR